MGKTVGYAIDSITRKHSDDASDLWKDYLVAKTFRQSRERMWRRSEKQYAGLTWEGKNSPDSDLINVNMSFSTVNTILPHLTGMEPEFMVSPFSKDSTPKNARIQEAYLNRMWRHRPVGAQTALKDATWDYLVYGDGFLKTTFQITERAKGIDQKVKIAEIYVDRLSPWDVWIDPNSDGIRNARWVAVRVWKTEDEVRQDTSLRIPKKYQFSSIASTDDSDSGSRAFEATSSDQRKWVVLFELYDVTNEIMYVVPRDGDQFPWKVVQGIQIPVEQIPNYRIPQSPWHMGDLEQIYDVQREIDKTRSQQITHRKRNAAKILVKEASITDAAEAALKSSVVGEMVPIQGDGPLDDLVRPIQLAPLPSESYAMSQQAQQDIFEITGISEYQRGSAPQITRTATEAQIMQGSSNVKIDAKLSDIELALRNIGTYMLGIAKDVYPLTEVDEMAMFIGGTDGRSISQLQSGEDARSAFLVGNHKQAADIAAQAGLYGEVVVTPTDEIFLGVYEVMVEHSSTDAMNPRLKAERFKDIAKQLAEFMPLLQQAGVSVDLSRMIRLWLEAASVPGVEAILSGSSPQQAQSQPVTGQPQPASAAPTGQVPDQIPPELLQAFSDASAGAAGVPGPPQAPVTANNSGALDPNAYPNVGN